MIPAMNILRYAAPLSALFAFACSTPAPAPDASTPDARADVVSAPDATVMDDAAASDASSIPDSAAQDSFVADAVTVTDTGAQDSASADVGVCAMSGETCNDTDNPCCAGLACMGRGGIGGRACADPMCRRTGEACDAMHPCCPSSACAGAPGRETCLPTP
jgi:hypothetical protein